MGGSAWSDDSFSDRSASRAASGAPVFAHTAATSSKPVDQWKAHATLDPKRVAGPSSPFAGQVMRESRDSTDHPESLAIAVLFDVTGSMGEVPKIVQAALPKLMGLLIRKGYADHPQIMVGGIGDVLSDQVPLQVGQFESGIEIDNDLTNLFLEGNGGGQSPPTESYDLALYFLARHTATDCFEKRGHRGYAFVVGDEMCRDRITKAAVAEVIGDKLEGDLETADLFAELQEKFDVYFILPNMTSHYRNPQISQKWSELLGPNLLRLEDPKGVSELIALTVGIGEGKVDIDRIHDDLTESGTELTTASAIRDALVLVSSGAGSRGSAISVPDSGASSGITTL